ncbi:copper resistance protein [Scheffersomyces xylosifermentans]|uniref:copper resistance protein n=1 Tax=Scheffersomyces xylosifermentans TaxID=1304137 RepID=UPI00315D156C
MVLINGVKYACERCIRGHRVTTCTHTDQPLTMIKPKGRPASQCQHCRENRKMKNLHITCTCGKKGKSPGMHLASCLCHKNSHCTCSNNQAAKKPAATNGNIHHQTASERAKKKSLITAANADILKRSNSSFNSSSVGNASTGASSPGSSVSSSAPTFNASTTLNSNYVIEDVIVPFETGSGLFDLFSSTAPSGDNTGNNSVNGSRTNLNDQYQTFSNSNSAGSLSPHSNNGRSSLTNELASDESNNTNGNNTNGNNTNGNNTNGNNTNGNNTNGNINKVHNYNDNDYDKNAKQTYPSVIQDLKREYNVDIDAHLSPGEIDMVDHMFPLFPLVGTSSFDDTNQPLSSLPYNGRTSQGATNTQSNGDSLASPESQGRNSINNGSSNGHYKANGNSNRNSVANSIHNSVSTTDVYSEQFNHATELSHTSSLKSNRPHQPKPIRPQPTAMPQSASSSISTTNNNNGIPNVSSSNPHYQAIRPKRPESVLSVTSNSSSRSFDVNHNNYNSSFINGGLPNSAISAAFPPSGPYGGYDTHTSNHATGFQNNDDSPHYHHFGRSGLGSNSSSTNIDLNYNDSDFVNSDNWFGELSSNNNATAIKRNPSLSNSSSFANIYEHHKSNLNDQRGLAGTQTPDVNNISDAYSKNGQYKNGAVVEETGEDETSSIPASQTPLDYDLSIPMFADMLSSYDKKPEYS